MGLFEGGKRDNKKDKNEDREIENWTSLKDEERIMRANLTGMSIPPDLQGKRTHPMFFDHEDTILKDTKKQLTDEGYVEGRDGIWKKPFSSH